MLWQGKMRKWGVSLLISQHFPNGLNKTVKHHLERPLRKLKVSEFVASNFLKKLNVQVAVQKVIAYSSVY